jgi:hypothetical protein
VEDFFLVVTQKKTNISLTNDSENLKISVRDLEHYGPLGCDTI